MLADADATERLGEALARSRDASQRLVVHLHGELGAGKSTLARSMLRALGVRGAIRSPTYTLLERYPLQCGEAVHMDLYRIGDAAELEFLGVDELDQPSSLWLVEWPERAGHGLPPTDLRIDLQHAGAGRIARLEGVSEPGRRWLQRVGEVAPQG
ncbi:MAG: tRNA (adenosine(37)-N6)-threonylcarbamoyltransferase complex ATPase subunit type 1 TsaE [Xanthomonadales bacterium]|nr:tRNA (adenosine(37)-N6)-threonylcarbamoyltransferase complex ATPase subunit type 1 TsaE [Xanthomonadales bacterium]